MSDALNLYLEEMEKTKMLLNVCGFDLFSKDPKANLRTSLLVFYIILTNLSQVYSCYYFRENSFELMFSLMTWPLEFMVTNQLTLLK